MYVDAQHDKKTDKIHIVERVDGKRIYKEYDPDYHFFIDDKKGKHTNIYGDPVKKIVPASADERHRMSKIYSNTTSWEMDINPLLRCLETEYLNKDFPDLHIAFFDIETDFHAKFGYSSPSEASNPITSIAVYLNWLDQMVCIAVPPSTITWEEAEEIAKQVPDVILCKTEKEMLAMFLSLIEDADILSGWNSEFFDIPYTVNRVTKLLGKPETRKFCLWDKLPTKRMIERGGNATMSYELIGRVHLDYMQLYKKYNFEQKSSYALNNIAFEELEQEKVQYDGTLDHLYKYDFKLFLEYNIQDTKLLDRLDKKLQFIDLASAIAHSNVVTLPQTMGSVVMTEQAVIVEAHSKGLVVQNKKARGVTKNADNRAAGGWVSCTQKGFHQWIGSSDLNSLYPSVIRALNMSTETLIGQVRTDDTQHAIEEWENSGSKYTFAGWWNDRFSTLEMENFFNEDKAKTLTLDMEYGESFEVTGAELKQLVFESGQPWSISANGTIFRNDKKGIIPSLLERWYNERKIMQAIKNDYSNDLIPNDKSAGIQIKESEFTKDDWKEVTLADPFEVNTAFRSGTLLKHFAEDKDRFKQYMNEHSLEIVNGKVQSRDFDKTKEIIGFWDKRQLVRKINLNSVYGGLLNEHHRFFDKRLGQSTTLTGRCITRHMTAKTNEVFTGEYDYNGITAIYNDTDSVYFSAYPALKSQIDAGDINWTKENVIKLYDDVSAQVSNTFPAFMLDTFNVPPSNGDVIKAGREIVAESALFIKKKRYAALVIDDEGKRMDVSGKTGKIKVTGLDLRRSDTPKFVQEFLLSILKDVLHNATEDDVIAKIRDFKAEFNTMATWQKGIPKSVNNLTSYKEREEDYLADKMRGVSTKGFTIPGHVRGSLNWNRMLERYNDKHTTKILDGSKIAVLYLRETSDNSLTNIAYPVDENHLPEWFLALPFDDKRMEEVLINNKIKNLLSVLKWDLARTSKDAQLMENLFTF